MAVTLPEPCGSLPGARSPIGRSAAVTFADCGMSIVGGALFDTTKWCAGAILIVACLPAAQGAERASADCTMDDATIVGTPAADVLSGTPERDVILALAGSDRVISLGGNDVVCGGPGHDRIEGGSGRDRLRGGRGRDVVHAGAGDDRVMGERGSDFLTGDAGDDRVEGGRNTDTLFGDSGHDRCAGGPPRDGPRRADFADRSCERRRGAVLLETTSP